MTRGNSIQQTNQYFIIKKYLFIQKFVHQNMNSATYFFIKFFLIQISVRVDKEQEEVADTRHNSNTKNARTWVDQW